jgi:hypothetical protein
VLVQVGVYFKRDSTLTYSYSYLRETFAERLFDGPLLCAGPARLNEALTQLSGHAHSQRQPAPLRRLTGLSRPL